MVRICVTLLWLLPCAACSVPEPVAVRTVVPPYLLECTKWVQPAVLTEGHIVALAADYAECRDHLAKV